MPASQQGIDPSRYLVIPRTTIFLRKGDSYLLLRGSPTRRRWPDLYNGFGGHLERGEDVLTSARRELEEECGLTADLWLCGTVIVNAGEIGVGLFVLTGKAIGGSLRDSPEGVPEWIAYERIATLPAVEDVPLLIARIHMMHRGDPPFAGRSYYDRRGVLRLEFGN